jgi:hypothetical protein
MFTPHSAQIDDELSKTAKSSLYWNDALTIGTPARIRDGVRTARQHGLGGYITSCEPFSCSRWAAGQWQAATEAVSL